jgi:hypothetical protein
MEFTVGYLAPRIRNNRGIVALGASPAASGAWDKADVLVTLSAPEGQAVDGGDLALKLDGHSFAPVLMAQGAGRFLLHDLPANGATLTVSLTRGDAFPADDSASLRLPLRRRITVAMAPDVPAPVQAVVRADPALVVGPPSAAQVALRMQQDPATPGLPEMVLVGQQGQDAAFRFTQPSGDQGTIQDALDQAGLAQFDAASLADGLHRPIGVEMAEGPAARFRSGPMCLRARWALRGPRPCRCSCRRACAGWPSPSHGCPMPPPGARWSIWTGRRGWVRAQALPGVLWAVPLPCLRPGARRWRVCRLRLH